MYLVSSIASDNGECYRSVITVIMSEELDQTLIVLGRKQQENEGVSVNVCAPHRLNGGLELNVCGVQCIKFFRCSNSSTTAQKQAFSFPLFLAKKKITILISSH